MAILKYRPMGKPHHDMKRGRSAPGPERGSVAVIVAAYEATRWIQEAVHSIETQALPEGWGLDLRVGVDGCGATAAYLAKMQVPYYLAEANVGTYVMRNSLIAVAPADAYAIFDADDVMLPGYLEALVPHAGRDGIAGGGRRTINHAGRVQDEGKVSRFASGVCVISRGAMERLGGYRSDRIGSDVDLVARAKELKVPMIALHQPTYWRRVHPGALTRAADTKFGSAARNDVITGHRHMRARGLLVVEPEVAPLRYVPIDGPPVFGSTNEGEA